MDGWIIVSLVLAVMVIFLFFRMGRKNGEVIEARKQAEREWTLKTALEKTFNLPVVEGSELQIVEGQIDKIMNGAGADEEKEEQMRLAVMELYARKAERKKK